MVLDNIEELIKKYDNGETSLSEEQQLKDYFSQETVAPHLEMYKPLFAYFLINQQEQFTKDIPLKSKKTNVYTWISVAAVAVLMLGVYFSKTNDEFSKSEQELAYQQVKTSLELVSRNFNKGTASMNYLQEIDKAGTQIGYLEELTNPMQRVFKK
jgi:hypothetical protein